jgi:hypothetical protein
MKNKTAMIRKVKMKDALQLNNLPICQYANVPIGCATIPRS